MDLLVVLSFSLFVTLFCLLDRIIFGIWTTPFNILSIPAAIVMVSAFFLAPDFGFVPFNTYVLIIWGSGLLLFRIGGIPISIITAEAVRNGASSHIVKDEKISKKYSLIMAWIVIIVSIHCLRQGLSVDVFGSDEYYSVYSTGLKGRIRIFGYGVLIFLIGTVHRKEKITLLTIFFLCLFNFLSTSKSWFFLPVIAGFIYRNMIGNLKISYRILYIILAINVLVFFISYLFVFSVYNTTDVLFNSNVYSFLGNHMLHYIFSGVLGVSEKIYQGMTVDPNPELIFNPILNIYMVITGNLERISPLNENLVLINLRYGKESNIDSFFGTLWLYLEPMDRIAYILLIGMLAYVLFSAAYIGRNCWIITIWAFYASALFFGFFGYYFIHLYFIEVFFYCSILAVLFILLRKNIINYEISL